MDAPSNRIRAGNQDRERVATRVQEAAGEGRLTLAEAEERLSAVYAATHVDELTALTRDLPVPSPPRPPRFPVPLRVHAAVVVVLSALLITRFAVSDAPFFWPVVPMFWLAVSLLAHAAVRARWRRVPY